MAEESAPIGLVAFARDLLHDCVEVEGADADELVRVLDLPQACRRIAARDAKLLAEAQADRAHLEEAARILRHMAHRTFAPSDSLSAWLKADKARKPAPDGGSATGGGT